MTLKAVLLDLWGTLIIDPEYRSGPRQAWRAANVLAALRRHGRDPDLPAVDAALKALSASLIEMHDAGRDVSSPRRVDLFLGYLDHGSISGFSKAALAEIEAAIIDMRDDVAPRLDEDAVETLAAIKSAGLKTGLISNAGITAAPVLRRMLAGYGLSPHLDVLVFSDELELAKPDRRVFEHALAGLGIEAGEAAFVGDSPHNDIFGAQAAGLLAVQVGDRDHDVIRPDARIERLGDLLPTLRRLSSPA